LALVLSPDFVQSTVLLSRSLWVDVPPSFHQPTLAMPFTSFVLGRLKMLPKLPNHFKTSSINPSPLKQFVDT
jgi:hypothetical protein